MGMQDRWSGTTTIGVTETGVVIHSEMDDDEPAILVVPTHPALHVTVGGTPVRGARMKISARDLVQIQLEDQEPVRSATVNIDDEGLRAVLRFRLEHGVRRRLEPTQPSAIAYLTVVEEKIPIQPVTLTEVNALLERHSVRINVDHEAIAQLLSTAVSGECVCATGVPAQEGEPEHFELASQHYDDLELIGIVPVHPVLSVRSGELVAIRRPAREGISGMTVTGQAIPPGSPQRALPVLGHGVFDDGGGRVFATRSGRIVSLPNLLDVTETLYIDGRHGVTEGHIVFDGDVVVNGEVEDGVEVLARGKVFVSGNVSRAKIIADGGMVISGGAFQSTLQAGTRLVSQQSLAAVFQSLLQELPAFVTAVEQVQDALIVRGSAVQAGRIAAKLIEEKFAGIKSWPVTLNNWLNSHEASIGQAWSLLVREVATELQQITLSRDTRRWRELIRVITDKISELPSDPETVATIEVRYAQRSTLTATGDILATEQGFYQCSLDAGKAVRCFSGVLLGCKVTAGTGLDVLEIGSQAEVNSSIHLRDMDGSVRAKTIHPGTLLNLGQWHHRVIKPMQHVVWP